LTASYIYWPVIQGLKGVNTVGFAMWLPLEIAAAFV